MPADRALADLFARQHGLITRSQALDMGFSDRLIGHRIRRARWGRVHHGVYRLAGTPDQPKQRLLAACLAAGTGALASHGSAAWLHGLPVTPHGLEVTIPWRRRISLDGVIVHRSRGLTPKDARRVDGIPVTSIARTLLDLSGVLPPDELEIVV